MIDVLLIGTGHDYQRSSAEFKTFLREQCSQWPIQGLAEEMSIEGLKNVDETVLASLGKELPLPHQNCDPSPSERIIAGIQCDYSVLDQYCTELGKGTNPNSLTPSEDKEYKRRLKVEVRKRESIWFQKLQDDNRWPTLFVCGALHVDSFKKLLADENIHVHVAAKNWTPNLEK